MKQHYLRGLSLGLILCASQVYAQTSGQLQKIGLETNKNRLVQLEQQLTQESVQERQRARQRATLEGIALELTLENGGVAELQRILSDGTPIYYSTFNASAAVSTRTNHLNTGGSLGLDLMGQNMTAHVWDAGHARISHQEYDGTGGTDRYAVQDADAEGGVILNFHSAHVTGTVMASGVQQEAQGMAPSAQVHGYRWSNDVGEAAGAAASGMLLSNHSYGLLGNSIPDQYFGSYSSESQSWDEIMYNAPYYLMVAAAGNEGNINHYNGAPLGGNPSYDKLTGKAITKNNLVVANALDANVAPDGSLLNVTINSSSSEGPTDDFRIKPDITGNGTNVYSTYASNDSAYNAITGTSMAAPNVMGSLLLIQEHYNDLNNAFAKAATLKGLALHTADDAGANGPDAIFGWGLLNAKRMAETITANGTTTAITELTLNEGASYQTQIEVPEGSVLKASISWTDAAGIPVTGTNDATPVLINDLDIRVIQNSDTFFPWRLTGVNSNAKEDNVVDPYERVDVDNANGTYTIAVTHKGTLFSGTQNFTLILTTEQAPDTTETQCVAEVLSLPYSEGFNNTLGLWTQDEGDYFDWTLRTGGTPSNSTGPSQANEDSHYIYMETSSPNNPYRTAILNSPCFDLSNTLEVSASFDYHMTGNAVGTIALEASTNNGLNWTSIWSQTGDQGGDWQNATIDLSEFDSATVKLRFYGISGSSWQGDIAIDNFMLLGNLDTEAPSVPLNLTTSNITSTSLDLSWDASTDNVSVMDYGVFVNGVLHTTVASTETTITELVPGTAYDITVNAKDQANNVSELSDVVTIVTEEEITSTQLLGSFFETGLDGWVDGGNDVHRYSGNRSSEGSFSMRLRDNSGTNSSITTATSYDLTGYDAVKITFVFFAHSMDGQEDFWVRIATSSGWQTVKSYRRGIEFENGTFYAVTVNIDSADYNFTDSAFFRFQNDASGNVDFIYIDEVNITGLSGVDSSSLEDSIVSLDTSSYSTFGGNLEDSFSGLNAGLSPNPAIDFATIRAELDTDDAPVDVTIHVRDIQGRMILERNYNGITSQEFIESIDVSQYRTGVYLVQISSSNGTIETFKLIKK